MNFPADVIRAATVLLESDGGSLAPAIAGLDDAALLDVQSALGEHSRAVARFATLAAGEIARRSSRELGYSGLAQAAGHRTPEALIQSVSGVAATEAVKLVRLGTLPDQSPLAIGVHTGHLSVDAADAIRRGLGSADAATSAASLDDAARRIAGSAGRQTPEELYRQARDARDALDVAGVARREQERRDLRFFRARQRETGMVTGSFALDQEEGVLLLAAIDTILSPRRGGPRFTCASEREHAEALVADPRTNDQLAADAFADIIRLAVDADSGTLFGEHRPAVRVIVNAEALDSGVGQGRLEAGTEAISITSVERLACATGLVGVLFSGPTRPLDVGRTQRLFTPRQRVALAVRDGGCLMPGCDRPPSFCEAHHIKHWHRDRGSTDVDEGVLLCRHHHMLMHNNGWEITRDGSRYWLVPPGSVDSGRTPIPLVSKNRLLREAPRPEPVLV